MNKRAYILGYFKVAAEGYEFKDLAREYVKKHNIPKNQWAKVMNEMKENWSEQQRVDAAKKLGIWQEDAKFRYTQEPGGGARYRRGYGKDWFRDWHQAWQEEQSQAEKLMHKIRMGASVASAGIAGLGEAFRSPKNLSRHEKNPLKREAMRRSREETIWQRAPFTMAAGGLGTYAVTHPRLPFLVTLPASLITDIALGRRNQNILDKKYKEIYKSLKNKPQDLPKAACISE